MQHPGKTCHRPIPAQVRRPRCCNMDIGRIRRRPAARDDHRTRTGSTTIRSSIGRRSAGRTMRDWRILGHGMCNTRFLYHYDEARERGYYRQMLDTVEQLTGVRMKGMGGPGPQAGTESTPDLMAE